VKLLCISITLSNISLNKCWGAFIWLPEMDFGVSVSQIKVTFNQCSTHACNPSTGKDEAGE
jgi:hypothetical protein